MVSVFDSPTTVTFGPHCSINAFKLAAVGLGHSRSSEERGGDDAFYILLSHPSVGCLCDVSPVTDLLHSKICLTGAPLLFCQLPWMETAWVAPINESVCLSLFSIRKKKEKHLTVTHWWRWWLVVLGHPLLCVLGSQGWAELHWRPSLRPVHSLIGPSYPPIGSAGALPSMPSCAMRNHNGPLQVHPRVD